MARLTAYRVLRRVDEEEAFSHLALSAELDASGLDGRDKGLATELVYGVLMWRRALDALLRPHVKRGLKKTEHSVLDILRIGAYQIRFLDKIPERAAVASAVELTKKVAPSSAGFVNAVLRRVAENSDALWYAEADRQKKPSRYLADRYSLPTWIANRALQTMGGIDRAEDELKGYATKPNMYLRRVTDLELPADSELHPEVPHAVRAEKLGPEFRSGLKAGHWVVQDIGAQIIHYYCGFEPGSRVLDACAGLGGKTLHFAQEGYTVSAVDPNASKLKLLVDTAKKLELAGRITVHECPLRDMPTENKYESILLDAPCSALGVIRRHPETRWTRTEFDVEDLADLQADLLDQAVELLEAGGILTYAVCTFAREETSAQMKSFLERHPEMTQLAPPEGPFDWAPYLHKDGLSLSLSPAKHDSDGFFAARFQKVKP